MSPSFILDVSSFALSPITSFASFTSLFNNLESSSATGFKEYFKLNGINSVGIPCKYETRNPIPPMG